MTGIEPAYLAWEASALPLSYNREYSFSWNEVYFTTKVSVCQPFCGRFSFLEEFFNDRNRRKGCCTGEANMQTDVRWKGDVSWTVEVAKRREGLEWQSGGLSDPERDRAAARPPVPTICRRMRDGRVVPKKSYLKPEQPHRPIGRRMFGEKEMRLGPSG